MSILDKVEIGNLVNVNLELSKERLPKETIEAINKSSECIIRDFKITDGMGIGVILKLSNGKEEWFFENEIEIIDEKGKVIEEDENVNKNLILDLLENFNYENKIQIDELLNPFNFINWFLVSVKDII